MGGAANIKERIAELATALQQVDCSASSVIFRKALCSYCISKKSSYGKKKDVC